MTLRSYDNTAVTGKPISVGDCRVSDEAYAELATKTVIACVDTVFYNREARVIYLARRNVYPMKGLWILGGRLLPSDSSPIEGMRRLLANECGFTPRITELTYLTTSFYRWDRISQAEVPGANLAVTFGCDVTSGKAVEIGSRLIRSEYESGYGLEPFTADKLVKGIKDKEIHPVLFDLYRRIFPR